MIASDRIHTNMNSLALVFAICCMSAAQARPGGYLDLAALGLSGGQSGGQGGGSPPPGNYQLVGVPDESAYADLTFPEQPIQDLGTISEGEVPADSVRVTKTITIKVPQPYPVEVSNPVPYPVEVAKPYPVPVTKLVHVPHPVPFDVKGSDSGSHGGEGIESHDQSGGYSSHQENYEDAGNAEQH